MPAGSSATVSPIQGERRRLGIDLSVFKKLICAPTPGEEGQVGPEEGGEKKLETTWKKLKKTIRLRGAGISTTHPLVTN